MVAPYGMPESPFGTTPPDFGTPPYGFPGFGGPPGFPEGFPGGGTGGFGPPGGLRISQDASDQAYGLTIDLDEGMDPAAIEVRPEGRSLVISRERSEQRVQEDSFDDGRGFARSFSYSSGSARRRLPVPWDADLGAMTREDADRRIRVTIPRRQAADSAQPGAR
jgi:hypothetical protein